MLNKNLESRRKIVEFLTREVVGPAPMGEMIDCRSPLAFASASEAKGPWRQADTGDEILHLSTPTQQYGVGVLYPAGEPVETIRPSEAPMISPEEDVGPDAQLFDEGLEAGGEPDDADDPDFSLTGTYRPSSMAVSFLVDVRPDAICCVEFTAGRYHKMPVRIGGGTRSWWRRSSVSVTAEYRGRDLTDNRRGVAAPLFEEHSGVEGLQVQLIVYSRPHGTDPAKRLITVAAVNRTPSTSNDNEEACLFQCNIAVSVTSEDGGLIVAYPEADVATHDPEVQSLALLYRHAQPYAVGHGCAADWEEPDSHGRTCTVRGVPLPTFEAPSMAAELFRDDGSSIEIAATMLSDHEIVQREGFPAMDDLVSRYVAWIQAREAEISTLDMRYHEAARRHMAHAREACDRMQQGIEYLRSDPIAREAFVLANRAMEIQSGRPKGVRKASYEKERLVFTGQYQSPEKNPADRGFAWRPFQIGFLLTAIRSTAESGDPHRETVDLLWFPTGGGKTEAYLALIAFSIFLRRLRNPDDVGVTAFMRYSLRLLTSQQFLRASRLVCAMEYLRLSRSDLGTRPITIGIWLGSSTTPNTRKDAVESLRRWEQDDDHSPFLLDRCPWCGAQLGKISRPYRSKAPRIIGYRRRGTTVSAHCPDALCTFSNGLPVLMIDEELYETPPSLLIATLDKFAMLAWKPEARSLFGLGFDGSRTASPPSLIVQDELHLVSGPLGSLVGLYEALIAELCTDRRGSHPAVPKIICATATTRRFEQQTRLLYARNRARLFPPPGLSSSDSFFSHYALLPNGQPAPGTLYVGVYAPGLGSMQSSQVWVISSLLEAANRLPENLRDPWWTLLVFFNSLRELGTTVSLLQSDIPDHLKAIANRTGYRWGDMRKLFGLLELTSGRSSGEITEAMSSLEIPYGSDSARPIDVCLASNIIEVGIDIDRLSLMVVTGQPKSTSQYIQVTGRVGRRWQERPGLVVTLYGASKPRDRSHYEHFRAYHQRLYAQVEPTSVTPFSLPTLERALHALMAGFVRQSGDEGAIRSPYPFPEHLLTRFREILDQRVGFAEPDSQGIVDDTFSRREQEWRRWERTDWDYRVGDANALLYPAGSYISPTLGQFAWPTMQSLRNVDAECQAVITGLYLSEGGSDDA